MESECRIGWADLPGDLLAIISDCLQQPIDIIRVRAVCRSWQSFLINTQNNPPLFPLSLSSCSWFLFDSANTVNHPHGIRYRPQYLIANSIYHLRSNKAPTTNWIVSVQESEPGNLLLSLLCSRIAKSKLVFDNSGEPTAVFRYYYGMCALRRCLNTDAGYLVALHGALNDLSDFVNFSGCIYAVDTRRSVYVLDCTHRLKLLPLTCVNSADYRWSSRKRFMVSDGDLYLLFSFCVRPIYHEIFIYKLVMDDIKNATYYRMEKVEDLGDRAFFLNKDCSFSVSARRLPPPLVGNCILVSRFAFPYCDCAIPRFYVHFLGVKPARTLLYLVQTPFVVDSSG